MRPIRERSVWLAALLLGVSAIAVAQSGTYNRYTRYKVLGANIDTQGLATGPDGALWFTLFLGSKIGRLTTSGDFSVYPLPKINSQPFFIAAGPDGAMWFTEYSGRIGRITTTGIITEYPVPNIGPAGIVAGPDGALWFTGLVQGVIGRITTAGVITLYPTPNSNSGPMEITAGPDGALWFTENLGGQIGRITTGGSITEYPISSGVRNQPFGIVTGPDGALWFTDEQTTGQSYGIIGRITTAGVITEYPHLAASSYPSGITAGPDGALWFTEVSGIARITTTGVITEYPVRVTGPGVSGNQIIVGPDRALWYVELDANHIDRATACGLGFSASFAAGTLTMGFNLGIDTPATFRIHLRNSTGSFAVPFSKAIPAVTPPRAFTMTWSPFPNLGNVTVEATLAAQPGGAGLGLCAEWTTVNTAQ